MTQIDALKLALGALEDSPMSRKNKDAIDALRETLAEHAMCEVQRLGQEIEPKIGCVNHDCDQCKAQPEQEPVAHCKVRPLRGDESFPKVEIDWVNQPVPGPLYATPPQRTWVGLTKNERLELYRQFENCLENDDCEYEKAIEQALKERNQ